MTHMTTHNKSNITTELSNDMNRRQFLKTGFFGGIALSTISFTALLTGCSSSVQTESGYKVLRAEDIVFFTALLPVILKPQLTTDVDIKRALIAVDSFLHSTSSETLKVYTEILDLATFPPTRIALGKVWKNWSEASEEDINTFLSSWKTSSVKLLQFAYHGLTGPIYLGWYLDDANTGISGYPGPPSIINS